jgi:hypothetical protein
MVVMMLVIFAADQLAMKLVHGAAPGCLKNRRAQRMRDNGKPRPDQAQPKPQRKRKVLPVIFMNGFEVIV